VLLSLSLPQPTQAHHRSQIQQLRALPATDSDGLTKIAGVPITWENDPVPFESAYFIGSLQGLNVYHFLEGHYPIF
jgi:hypothetical protein